MPRLRQIPHAEAALPVRNMYDLLFGKGNDPMTQQGTSSGTPGDWWSTFANSVEVFEHCLSGFALYRGSAAKLDPKLRELGQCRAGWARGSQFVFSQHQKAMRTVGFSEEQVQAIPFGAGAPCWSPLEAAVLTYADCLVLEGGRVPDAVFDALRAGGLDDEQILLLTYITCLYDMHAVMSKALRTEFDDRPDPVAEVGAHEPLRLFDTERR